MVMLRAEGVRFGYGGGKVVLDGIDLSVEAGECVCLMGVNGCGKSTLLDCVLGIHKLQGGAIDLDGRDASRMSARELARYAAYVPQVHERSFPYEVAHIVLMGRTAHAKGLGSPDDSETDLALSALERCGISHLADRPYTSLSGGEMQMVMLARALVQQTPLILMDEPTAHLDFRNELLFLETIEELVMSGGISVLMATHAPNQAFHLQSSGIPVKVALMAKGKVSCCGAPDDVLDEASLRETFGVVGGVFRYESETEGRVLRQIVPVRSVPAMERQGR